MTNRTTFWNTPYTFSGKEKDVETVYGYVKKLRFFSSLAFGNGKQVSHYTHCLRRFGARYYDSGLSIWLSVDPMSDKYPSMSPYNYCANNPQRFVDPNGLDFYDQNANFLGKSTEAGVYIVTNQDEIEKIKANQAQNKSTSVSEVPQAIKLPSEAIRTEAVDRLVREDKRNPNREYGGYFGKTANGLDKINWAKPGDETDPCSSKDPSVKVFDPENESDRGTIFEIEATFHSHSSGTGVRTDFSNTNSIYAPPQKNCFFQQEPTPSDYDNASKRTFVPISYVIALGSSNVGGQKVYIYNKNGAMATFPLDAFKNLKD